MNKDQVNHLDERKNKQSNGKSSSKNNDKPGVKVNGVVNNNKKDATPVKEPNTANAETPNNVETNDKTIAEIIVKKVPEIKPEQAENLATKIQNVKKEEPSLSFETIINRVINKIKKKFTDDGKCSESIEDKTPTGTGDDKNNKGSDTNKDDISNNQSSDNVTDNTGGEEVENTSGNQKKNKNENGSDTKSSDKDELNNGDFDEYETLIGSDSWIKNLQFFISKPVMWFGGKVSGIAEFIGDAATLGLLSRKTIKGRFRKTTKTLYKLQMDFGGSEKGLDMNDALKGQGSRLMDMIMRVFFVGNKYSIKGKGGTGAIGIIPLVNNYRNELKRDFVDAVKTYNMIANAGNSVKQPEDLAAIKDSYVPEYKSFAEAYNARMLNESAYQREDLYETLTDFIAEANTPKINYSEGKYVTYALDKNGNLKPSQAVQVTPDSTREICYSIMNIFFSKYFNMKNVSKKFGIDVNSLSDIDKSNVDKFTKIVKLFRTEQSDNNIASKMFARVEKRYNSMVSSYKVIAEKIIDNFYKYSKLDKDGTTKVLSEKDSNLLTAATTKLREKLNEQIDIYENNFYRVVNALIATPEYATYMRFIIERVIPVFATGNAADADFILDTLPKVGEVFIVRQTRDKNVSKTSINVDGTAALVKILSIDNKENHSKSPIVKIQRVGKFKPVKGHEGGQIAIDNNGNVDYKSIDFKTSVILDRTAFSTSINDTSGDTIDVPYNKWLAIDPVPVTNYSEASVSPETKTGNNVVTLGRKIDDNTEEYVFIIPNEKNDSSVGSDNAGTPYSSVSSSETPSKEFEPDTVMNEYENIAHTTVSKITVLRKDQNGQSVIDIVPIQKIAIDKIISVLKNNDNNFVDIKPADAEARKEEANNAQNNGTRKVNNEEGILNIINNMKSASGSSNGDNATPSDNNPKQQPKVGQDTSANQKQKQIDKNSFNIQYDSPDINESLTTVTLVRNMDFKSNNNMYVVSINAWGDGSRINPKQHLEESIKNLVNSAKTYSDIAHDAKKDNNIKLLPLTESVTYQVPMPYNRYAILTNGNPLYEAVAVITIDATPDHNITSSNFIGVTSIVK